METPPLIERKKHAYPALASWNPHPSDHLDPAVAVIRKRDNKPQTAPREDLAGRKGGRASMPWKWEILKEQLVATGRRSFAAQAQAHDAGQAVLAE